MASLFRQCGHNVNAMKPLFLILALFTTAVVSAQTDNDTDGQQRQRSDETEVTPQGRGNDPTFRDDSTDASMSPSTLSSTPGTATTTGAGGLGTNENSGYNTSSDIYMIERRDSIRQARQDSLERARRYLR